MARLGTRNTRPMSRISTRAGCISCASSTTSSTCRRPRPASWSCTRIGDGGLSASVELQAGLPRLRADERKTKQLLINLVSNAVKFTPPGGHIEIASRFEPETGMIVTVSDTGIGIAPENLARVFEPFEQVDSPFIRSRQGTGLGLPLGKAIIERHGGTIAVHSEAGVGTQVSVPFPPRRA